jgi:hypothetical protein
MEYLKMFELMGLVITAAGLLLTALSLLGVFSDKNKIEFFELIFKTEEEILRDGGIFESFLRVFPPKNDVARVTKIMPRRMDCSSSGRDAFSSVYYQEDGLPGQYAVATESEVKEWAYKTTVTITGLIITFIGFTLQVIKYAVSL